MSSMAFKMIPRLFSGPERETDDGSLSPAGSRGEDTEGDPAEDVVPRETFKSKYIQFFPLYQEYCLQEMKGYLERMSKSPASEVVSPRYIQELQSPGGFGCHSEATLPPPEPLEPTPTPPPLPLSRPIPTVTPGTLWQDLEEVNASGILSDMTPREIHLQELMFELIGSEASYLRSLRVVINHFYASKPLKETLSRLEHHTLFSNICGVTTASEKFLMDLEQRLGQSVFISQIGDVVLGHCPHFRSLYVPYVTNMMYQEALVNQLLERNREFQTSVKKLEADPACQRQNLKSFLVLPFQRITRIKLLLETILKKTEADSDSSLNLTKAIEAIHEIVTECEKSVRKMKCIEELVSLEMLIDFNAVKWVPLVVSGRFLVHEGSVRQLTVDSTYSTRVSFISVHVHLFNDLLIISTKKDQRFTVVEHASFPTQVHVEALKTKALGLPPESFLLHLSRRQNGHPTALILVAYTRSEKEAWMKALSSKH
ncbi:rho guanine nucleotide exchange factor 19 isoform X2 [Nelusetta ayraudi]